MSGMHARVSSRRVKNQTTTSICRIRSMAGLQGQADMGDVIEGTRRRRQESGDSRKSNLETTYS